MESKLRQQVIERAEGRCEYCHLPQLCDVFPFQVDHVVAEKHHGATESANLAWSWYSCNSYKGPCVGGIDIETKAFTRFFNPRSDVWHQHFTWNGPELLGTTEIGRVTVDVLRINLPERVEHRRLLLAAGQILA